MAANYNFRGKLTITIHSGRNLAVKQLIGQMDPFATVNFGHSGEKFKTPVAQNGDRTPQWNFACIANLDGREDAMHLRVLNKGNVTDDLMSRADIDLPNLDLSGEPHWYSLRDPDNFSKECGEIGISITFEGTGIPPNSTAEKTHEDRLSKARRAAFQAQQASPPPANVVQYSTSGPVSPQAQQPQYQSPPPQQPPQYQQPPVQQYQQPPVQQYGSQPQYQPPVQQYQTQPQQFQPQPVQYQAPPPVYQPPPQVVMQQPPQVVYQQPPPQVIYQQPQPVVVVQQQPTSPFGGIMNAFGSMAAAVGTGLNQMAASLTNTRGKFDDNGYLQIHADVKNAGMSGWSHYDQYGHTENRLLQLTNGTRGRWDDNGYLTIHPDVKNAGMTGWNHYKQYGHNENRDIVVIPEASTISVSVTNNRGKFDDNGYLSIHADVKNAGMSGWSHYDQYGHNENRLLQLTNGTRGRWDDNGYLAAHPDVKNAGMTGWNHYHLYGHTENRDIVLIPEGGAPTISVGGGNRGKWDDQGYLNLHPDVRAAGMTGWNHYKQYGHNENRFIRLTNGTVGHFDPFGYLNIHPDVKAAGMNGWDHYNQYGHNENRDIMVNP